MYCPGCKNGLQYSWAFCPSCGRDVTAQSARPNKEQKLGSYGSGIRGQIFELTVRHALAGLPWKQSCAAAMRSNEITVEEIEAEVCRRMSSGEAPLIQLNQPACGLRPQVWTP